MSATGTTNPPDRSPGEQAIAVAMSPALAEAASVTTRAIRLLGRLLDAEDANLTGIESQEADAKRAMLDAPSLAAAQQAGQDMDDCKAERAALVPRVIALTNANDRAARSLRHTAALHARFLSGRPFRPLTPGTPTPGTPTPGAHRPPPASHAARDPGLEPAERPDFYDAPERFESERIETTPERAATTSGQAQELIARDLAAAAACLTPKPNLPPRRRTKDEPGAWHFEPGKTRPFPDLTNPATRPQPPDT